jgi:hypothetical protein
LPKRKLSCNEGRVFCAFAKADAESVIAAAMNVTTRNHPSPRTKRAKGGPNRSAHVTDRIATV